MTKPGLSDSIFLAFLKMPCMIFGHAAYSTWSCKTTLSLSSKLYGSVMWASPSEKNLLLLHGNWDFNWKDSNLRWLKNLEWLSNNDTHMEATSCIYMAIDATCWLVSQLQHSVKSPTVMSWETWQLETFTWWTKALKACLQKIRQLWSEWFNYLECYSVLWKVRGSISS